MIQAISVNPNYYYPNGFETNARDFFNSYSLVLEQSCPDSIPQGLKPRNERICRFCNKKIPFVTFYNDAHVIPKFLGNQHWISDFECDDCNSKFSRYETDLSYFLGSARTVQSAKRRKFKSADKKVVAENIPQSPDGSIVQFRRFDSLDGTFEFDKDTNTTSIHYTRTPYTPLNVYKALLKIALTVLPTEYTKEFKFTYEYLLKKPGTNSFMGFEIVTAYIMPLTFNIDIPVVMLFKKSDPSSTLFSFIFTIHTLNYIYQIILPFNSHDRHLYENRGSIDALWCPPLFGRSSNEGIESIDEKSFHLDSEEKVSGEKESIHIPTNPIDFERSLILKKETGEVEERKFDGKKIVGIDIKFTRIP